MAAALCQLGPAARMCWHQPAGLNPRLLPASLDKLSPFDLNFNATGLKVTIPAPLSKLQQYVQEVAANVSLVHQLGSRLIGCGPRFSVVRVC